MRVTDELTNKSAAWKCGIVSLVLVSLVAVTGCKQLTPEEQLVEARSRYEATLNNFIVTQVPLVEEVPADESDEGEAAIEDAEAEPTAGEAAADPTADDADGGATENAVQEVPVRQDVTVDITIRHESDHELDGITVDIYMSDGQNEIRNWKVWFDTTAVRADTPGVQFSHTFEDVDYQEGYGFAAEIRSPVAPAERGDYREFSQL